MAAEYAADLEDSAYNALYERPGVIALLPEVAGRRVLDVGCGSGPLSAWLADRGAEVLGFDVSPSMVRLAERRGLRSATFAVADLAEPLRFLADASFDVAVASLVIHYLRDWVPPLRELRRVLKPDGVLVLSTHHPAADVELATSDSYFERELLHDRWLKGGREFDVSFWRRPLTEMSWSFAQAGFQIDVLSEPQPLPECRERDPEAWRRLTRNPHFILFRLTPRAQGWPG